jgi:hypothetical protein
LRLVRRQQGNNIDSLITSHSENGERLSQSHLPLGADPFRTLFRSFYSEANVSFIAAPRTSVTTLDIDAPDIGARRSGAELSSEISQLLIDIDAADSGDLRQWVTRNEGQAPPPKVINVRLKRFTSAFALMFQTKKYKGINRTGGNLSVEFEEHGKACDVNQLSTGEKQIIFRAGFLLRDLAAARSSVILIDEPELSLSPQWQEKILQFYQKLLIDTNGQHAQIIVATHSPFIVHGAANAKVIVLQKDVKDGRVTAMATPTYPVVSGIEAIHAFNVESFLQLAEARLLILTEGETDAIILRTAWSKLLVILDRPSSLDLRWGKKTLI